MRPQKTYSERFMELPTDAERWRFVKENVKAWCKELDAEIEQAESRSRHLEEWLNLYELNPDIAKRNPHMGIVVTPKPQQ